MNSTTQIDVKTSTDPMSRRVIVDHFDLRFKILKGAWYVDTLIFKVKLILGNTVANIYTQGKFVKVYPIMSQREAGQSPIEFTVDVNVTETLITVVAGDFTGHNT